MGRNRENDKYNDGIRDLTVPQEARLAKTWAWDVGSMFVCLVRGNARNHHKPPVLGSQSKSTRQALSGVFFQTKHPMDCLVNRSL